MKKTNQQQNLHNQPKIWYQMMFIQLNLNELIQVYLINVQQPTKFTTTNFNSTTQSTQPSKIQQVHKK